MRVVFYVSFLIVPDLYRPFAGFDKTYESRAGDVLQEVTLDLFTLGYA